MMGYAEATAWVGADAGMAAEGSAGAGEAGELKSVAGEVVSGVAGRVRRATATAALMTGSLRRSSQSRRSG
jgi:hypothetical protein